jgi:hypothetical protein
MFLKRCLFFLIILPSVIVGFSQESVVPAFDYPPLTEAENKGIRLKSAQIQDTISLPFFDDFSGQLSPYPKPSLWMDSFVYINNSRAVNPLSIGVATFDALNQKGRIYTYASDQPFYADALTSKPIYMNYPVGSDARLSFYYQPQGYGDSTEVQDSLMVDFYSPKNKKWWNVWRVQGNGLHPFKAVIIPVNADSFLMRGFQFRFRNKASIQKNYFDPGKMADVDHWNIDYVKLNIKRWATDTVMRDVAFERPISSLLNNYQSMPWRHFQVAFQQIMRKDIDIYYRNNDSIGHKPDRYFKVTDLKGPHVTSFFSGNENVDPQEVYHFSTKLEYPFFTDETDSARFEVKSYITSETYDNKINDTTRFIQIFSNYFAYDDGTPEFGYGLSGQGTLNGKVASRFTSYYPDSLAAIKVFFNSTVNEITATYPFRLTIWSATTSGPGQKIYQSTSKNIPEFGKYTIFLLDSSLLINGDFYVGWEQEHENFLNVGIDRNNSGKDRLFYNTGSWTKSAFDNGSLMIRPVFGSRKLATSAPKPTYEQKKFKIYPNPTSGILNIEFPELGERSIYATLLNSTGKLMLQTKVTSNSVNLEDIPSGLYFIVLTEDGKTVYKGKVLVQH